MFVYVKRVLFLVMIGCSTFLQCSHKADDYSDDEEIAAIVGDFQRFTPSLAIEDDSHRPSVLTVRGPFKAKRIVSSTQPFCSISTKFQRTPTLVKKEDHDEIDATILYGVLKKQKTNNDERISYDSSLKRKNQNT